MQLAYPAAVFGRLFALAHVRNSFEASSKETSRLFRPIPTSPRRIAARFWVARSFATDRLIFRPSDTTCRLPWWMKSSRQAFPRFCKPSPLRAMVAPRSFGYEFDDLRCSDTPTAKLRGLAYDRAIGCCGAAEGVVRLT